MKVCRYCGLNHEGMASRESGQKYISAGTRQWIACREALGTEIVNVKQKAKLTQTICNEIAEKFRVGDGCAICGAWEEHDKDCTLGMFMNT